ncbi:MAG: hypothetical protein JWM30_4153 [Burkholderia sp.]|nr:hypothetical protein [Burkholderia sp.]
MNNEAALRYVSPAQTLTPIFIPSELFAALQKEGKIFEHISLSSRSSERSLLENNESIATVQHNPPVYQTISEPIAIINHTPPIYQTYSEPQPLVVNTVKNSSKRATVFDRVASDIDARFSKPELKSKAQKATNEFLDAMAPRSAADIDSSVHKFRNSMNEISARFEKFKTSSLSAGIELDIGNTISQVAAKKFTGTNSQAGAACIQNVQKVLALLDKPETETPDPFVDQVCKHLANQTLKIFQEHLFTNLKIQAGEAMKDLLSASKPGSETSITSASIVFNKAMKIISDQRVHLQGHESYENFGSEIAKAANSAATKIFWNDVKKNNKADWIMIRKNLGKEYEDTQDDNFPKDIRCASARLKTQLEWMNEQDFLEHVEGGIQGCIERRLEIYMVANSQVEIKKNT